MNRKPAEDMRIAAQSACPICGHPLIGYERVAAQHDRNFQCRFCWTRIGHTNGILRGPRAAANGNGRHA